MNDGAFTSLARNDFSKARTRQTIGRILALFTAQRTEMLSLGDVRSLLRPDSETYRGLRTVPVSKIIGSEGRAKDFDRAFLPRHDALMKRWVRVDVAHYRDISLPPVKLFEIGGVFFVRDGNHRVSVARAKGAEFMDAEVISLASQVAISPGMSLEDLRTAVIALERKDFQERTHLDMLRPEYPITFTTVGRFDEILEHISVHKWFINKGRTGEIPFGEAVVSWCDAVYAPIIRILRESRLLARFAGRTESDLYVYVGRHWDELTKRYGPIFTLEEAAEDLHFSSMHPKLGERLRKVLEVFGINLR